MSARIYLLLSVLLAVSAPCAPTRTSPVLTAGLSAKVSLDNNIYLQEDTPLASGQTQAAVPANASSVASTVGLNLGVTWKAHPALALEAAYAPAVFGFSGHSAENHADHRVTLNATGAASGCSYEIKTRTLFTQGSEDSPVFNRLGGTPAIGGEAMRSRRTQDIYKGSARVLHAGSCGFVRGVLAWSDQDFHTRESPTPGCANYVDRGEWSAGAEAGWNVWHGLALVGGVRQGHQHQNDLLGKSLNYTNSLTRWLVGVEQTASPVLKFSLLAGPDIRRFGAAVRDGFNRSQTTTFIEGSGTWTPDPADSVVVSGLRYLWLSSGGRGSYVDTVCDVTWKHRLAADWSLSAGINRHTGYAGRFNPPSPRHDVILISTLTVSHSLDKKTRVELSVLCEDSDTLVTDTPARAYARTIASLGVERLW